MPIRTKEKNFVKADENIATVLLLATFCVKPTLAPAMRSRSECPNAKTSTSIYASKLPRLAAKDIIATSGAEAQGVLTSPKTTPTKKTPKNLS